MKREKPSLISLYKRERMADPLPSSPSPRWQGEGGKPDTGLDLHAGYTTFAGKVIPYSPFYKREKHITSSVGVVELLTLPPNPLSIYREGELKRARYRLTKM
jgi:hypothetical protein